MKGHVFITPKRTRVTFCERCGLVPLANAISTLCIRLGCDYSDAPAYRAWVASGRKVVAQ